MESTDTSNRKLYKADVNKADGSWLICRRRIMDTFIVVMFFIVINAVAWSMIKKDKI